MLYEHKEYMQTPTETQTIIENGTYDVTDKASAIVNVSTEFIVTCTYDDSGIYEEPTFTCDKTYAEILSALNAGKAIIGYYYTILADGYIKDCTRNVRYIYNPDADEYYFSFKWNVFIDEASSFNVGVKLNSSNVLERYIWYPYNGPIRYVTLYANDNSEVVDGKTPHEIAEMFETDNRPIYIIIRTYTEDELHFGFLIHGPNPYGCYAGQAWLDGSRLRYALECEDIMSTSYSGWTLTVDV